ncbi:MAG: hypothetical protein GY697_00040 [Desulfobacterales bacterium]|nr:hypothetical protein [Desulfobacterales bacterium]
MKTIMKRMIGFVVILALALLAGCVHDTGVLNQTGPVDADRFEKEIQQAVAACRVNARELDKIYDRLHNAAADEASRSTSGLQLGYIQKTYLYIHQAGLVAAYQIRLLSVYPYIKDDRRADVLTLRAQDLDQAISEMEASASFLEVYAAFIQDRQVRAEIETGRQLISGTIYLYEKLLETIKPAVNPAAPFSKDPYGPFSRGT